MSQSSRVFMKSGRDNEGRRSSLKALLDGLKKKTDSPEKESFKLDRDKAKQTARITVGDRRCPPFAIDLLDITGEPIINGQPENGRVVFANTVQELGEKGKYRTAKVLERIAAHYDLDNLLGIALAKLTDKAVDKYQLAPPLNFQHDRTMIKFTEQGTAVVTIRQVSGTNITLPYVEEGSFPPLEEPIAISTQITLTVDGEGKVQAIIDSFDIENQAGFDKIMRVYADVMRQVEEQENNENQLARAKVAAAR